MRNKNTWRIVATGAIVLSLLTLLLPIVTYTNSLGVIKTYNVFGILGSEDFAHFVFVEYTGTQYQGVPYSTIEICSTILCCIGIAAIICAFVGINCMSKQYESTRPFRLAMCGLVGTAVPSIALLLLYGLSFNQYKGVMNLGAYLLVTPIAMVCAILAVTSRHRLTREEMKVRAAASAYIRPAGDLPETRLYDGSNGGGYYD